MSFGVLIVGDNRQNELISEFFERQGYEVSTLDVETLRSLEGEAADFYVITKQQSAMRAEFVILTGQPATKPVVSGGLQTFSVYDEAERVIESKADRDKAIVFLLDYIVESPAAATIYALKQAVSLARAKHPVYYFSKFVRTAESGAELLYRGAREAGVTFVKYETLCLEGDEDSGKFTIKASDGVFDVELQSKSVFADGGTDTGGKFAEACKKLKLTTDESGNIAQEEYFVSPAHTSRRGVYYLSRDIFVSNPEKTLKYIVNRHTNADWKRAAQNVAVVEGDKCVLCLNCVRACTHAALSPDNKVRQMRVFTYACEGCGSCVSVCPSNAIILENHAACKPKSEKSDKILALCCENSAAIAMEKALLMLGEKAAIFETISVPCGGRIRSEGLLRHLHSSGKVLSAVCMDGACRHFSGDKRACKQTESVKNMLETAGILPDCVHFIRTSHVMPGVLHDELIELIKDWQKGRSSA